MSDLRDATSWAVTEFADADLGDLRRTQRLVQLAQVLAQNPGAALPEACGSGAMLKAASRFFANDDILTMSHSPNWLLYKAFVDRDELLCTQ